MSGKILELKRWERASYFPDGPGGPEISMEFKRLRRHEARALRKVMVAIWGEIEKGKAAELTQTQKADIMRQIFDVVPDEELTALFQHVRNVEGVKIDGEKVTSGAELLQEPDDSLLLWVLGTLQNLAGLTPVEGFRSGSRSTSPAETASRPDSPASDATPTASADGQPPSDATPSPEPELELASTGSA